MNSAQDDSEPFGKLTLSQRQLIADHIGGFLAAIEEAFNQGSPEKDTPQQRRWRYLPALLATAELAEALGAETTPLRMHELCSALLDLDDGQVSDLLKKDPNTGRPPQVSNVWRIRMLLCLAYEAASLAQLSVSDASEYIASRYKFHERLLSAKSARFQDALVHWNGEFRQGKVRGPVNGPDQQRAMFQDMYRLKCTNLHDRYHSQSPASMLLIADRYIEHANRDSI